MPLDLATTHLDADPDGLGGLLALRLLRGPLELGLPGGMDPVARQLWADHAADLPRLLNERELRQRLAEGGAGRLLVADASRPDRLGWLAEHLEAFTSIEAFDTHPPTEGELPRSAGPAAGAATSPLVLALRDAGLQPSPAEAGVMLVGIHTDTGHFTFPSTTRVDHEAASLCLSWGADPALPARYAPRGYTAHQLHLLEEMAASAQPLAAAGLTLTLLQLETESWEPDLASLLTGLREAEGWAAAVLVASSGGRVQVIARSDGRVDVARLCAALGGGGHSEAAAATLDGVGLSEARAMAAAAARAALSTARRAGDVALRAWISAPASAPVAEVAARLRTHGINALPLTRGEGDGLRVVGQVTRRDAEAALRHGLADAPADSISAHTPPRIDADAPLVQAQAHFAHQGGRLMMVGPPDAPPEGLLTRTGLLRELAAQLAPPTHRRPPHPRILLGLLRKHLGPAWSAVERAGQAAAAQGDSAHLVGGAVRDLLLEHPVHDVDLVIEGDAHAVARALARDHGGDAVLHAAFGTAKWRTPDGIDLDLARARAEVYPGRAALPEVLHAALRRDLGRRDFTINAMAVTVSPDELGVLVDPHGGYADLERGVLRVLHGLSFHDDPTRAIRAARFAGRFGFQLAEDTAALLRAALRADAFAHLGRERLGAELDRLLAERAVVDCLQHLSDWGLLSVVHPRLCLTADRLDIVRRVRGVCQELRGARGGAELVPPADALWVVLGQGVPAEDRQDMGRLVPGDRARQELFVQGPQRVARAVARLQRVRRPSFAARTLQPLADAERVVVWATVLDTPPAAHVRWWEREGRHLRTAWDGHQLQAEGVARGPALGAALRAAQDAAWDGHDAAAQLAAARTAAARHVAD